MARKVRLGAICDSKISTISSEYSGKIEYIDISSVDNVQKRIISSQFLNAQEAPSRAKQLIHFGDILVSMVRPNLNAVAMVQKETKQLLVASTGYCVLRCKPDVDNRYLFYFCQSPFFIATLTAQATGASYPAVNASIIKDCLIPLPSLEIQNRIATIIDNVSGLISLRKQQLAKLDELVKARFVEMFESYFEAVWEQPLNAVCDFIDYRGKTPEKSDSGVPLITAKNVRENGFSVEPREFIPAENYEKIMTRGFPQVNDVLFTTEAPLGNVCRIPDVYERFCVGQRIITMHPHDGIVTSEYLEYSLLNRRFQEKLWEKATGSTVKGIRSQLLEWIAIPVPPFGLQRNYSEIVAKAEKHKLTIKQGLDKMEMLKKALMQECFG